MQPWLPVALAIAQGVSQYVGERAVAKDQEAQNAELRQNALEARTNDLEAIAARRKEEQAAASQRVQDSQRQALQERSTAIAGNTQSGLSVNALLDDYLRKSLENENVIQTNLSNVSSQLDRERVSAINLATSRVNQAPSVRSPSFLSSGLKIGADAYSTYQRYKPPEVQPPKPKSTVAPSGKTSTKGASGRV